MKVVPNAEVARRLRVRGFENLTEEEVSRLGTWMCFTPMLQAILFGVCTVTGSSAVLCVLAAFLLFGTILGRHPFDWLYDGVIRFLEGSPRLPPSPPRRRAVFALGVAWCLTTAAAFTSGNMAVGYVLGGVMTLSTALLALTHICIPSRVLGWFVNKAGLDGGRLAGGTDDVALSPGCMSRSSASSP